MAPLMAILLAHPAQATSVRELIDKGAYADAVTLARDQYARSPEIAALDQLVEALCANGEGAARIRQCAGGERAPTREVCEVGTCM